MRQSSHFPSGDGYPGNGPPVEDEPSYAYDSDYEQLPSGVERLCALFETIWAGKWIILGVFALVVGAAATYTFTQTPQYEASTLLVVENGQNRSAGLSLTPESNKSALAGGQRRTLSNQVLALNESDSLALAVALRLDTMETNPNTGERLDILGSRTGERRSRAAIARVLRGNVRARKSGLDVDAIEITATSAVPSEAAVIADQYAAAYLDWTREKSLESLRAKRQFLEQQSDKFGSRVQQAEQALANYMQEEEAVSLDQEASRLVEQLSALEARRGELQIELDMAESALNTKKKELERIRPRLVERLSSGTQTELKRVQQEKANVVAEISRVKTRNPDLRAGGEDPRARELRRLQRRAERLEEQADSLADKYVERTLAAGGIDASSGGEGGRGLSYVVDLQRQIAQQEIKVNGLRAQINTAERQITENRHQMQTLPPKSLRLADLKRQRQSVEQTHSFIRQKLQETRMAEESEGGFAERLRAAAVSGRPISPRPKRTLFLAALVGLFLGGGLVVLREKFDTVIRGPADVEDVGEHVIGVVPSMEQIISSQFDGAETVDVAGRDVPSSLIMLTAPTSDVAEAYRRLQTNLRFARSDAEVRSFIVASPSESEGKTTTALNLAVAEAQAEREVLLLDGDLRKSKVHSYFDLPKEPGLAEALNETPRRADLPKPIDNLWVLPGGSAIQSPSESFGGWRMRRLIDKMEDSFDLVIVDTPPILLFNDPVALVRHTDGALLVAAAGQTDGPAFKHAISLLEKVDASCLGTVLNRFRPDQQREWSNSGKLYEYSVGLGYESYSYQYG